MKLEDQVVSLELAKKLKELGVLQNGAFDYFENTFHPEHPFIILRPTTKQMEDAAQWICSAFTVAELGEMLPLWYYSKRLPDGSWSTDHVSRMDILNTNEKTEADSRAAMLIQIIERKIVRL